MKGGLVERKRRIEGGEQRQEEGRQRKQITFKSHAESFNNQFSNEDIFKHICNSGFEIL